MAVYTFEITSIDETEALRYLGHSGQAVSEEIASHLHEQARRCCELAQPRASVEVFSIEPGRDGRQGGDSAVRLEGCELELRGVDIARHLHGARACAVMAVTLGVQTDRQLRLLAHTSAFDQAVFDACASELVERAADATEARIVETVRARGLFPNTRYSPGYGDFDISVQPKLLRVVDAQRKLGLTASDSNLLVPTKSVTAVVGLFDEPQPTRVSLCPACRCYDFCSIRTTGRTCRG